MQYQPLSVANCHLVFGFLGSGKTTLINRLIAHAPPNETQAILVNEVGEIGVDDRLFAKKDGLHIRQIAGGCICCTSQLALHIALAQLLGEARPDRLWIEPTGLAHPRALLSELSLPHWRQALRLRSAVGVLSAEQWQQSRYRDHKNYIAHVRFADVVVVNRAANLNKKQQSALINWIKTHNPNAATLIDDPNDFGGEAWQSLWNTPSQTAQAFAVQASQALPKSPIRNGAQSLPAPNPKTDPSAYRYHRQHSGVSVVGWRLGKNWRAKEDALIDWLLRQRDWQRIKGAFLGENGWQTINFTPDSLSLADASDGLDNRLEIIFAKTLPDGDFESMDRQLATLFQDAKSA